MLQLTLLKNIDSFVSYDFLSVPTLKNHISQTTWGFWAKSVGEPFKNHALALVKFQPSKSSKKKGVVMVWHVWRCHGMSWGAETCQTLSTPFSLQLCPCQNLTIGKTWFLKGVATDFARKSRVVYLLWIF